MSNEIVVSIVVPCFNQAKYLNDALQSVVNQTFTHWECIIINDGSTDDTDVIANKWLQKDKRFKYLYTINKGVSNARNLGVQNCTGHFIQFLDCDDILEKEKINYQVSVLLENTLIDIVYSSSRYFFSDNKSVLFPIHYKGVVPSIEMNFNDTTQKEVLIYKNVCTICSSLYRRKIFKNISFKNMVYEDWYFHIECAFNDFIFHYSYKENCNSLIRMTVDSQLIKHDIENNKTNLFKETLDLLLIKKNFESTLIRYRDVKKVNISKNKNNLKSLFFDFIPPIVVKLYGKIKLF